MARRGGGRRERMAEREGGIALRPWKATVNPYPPIELLSADEVEAIHEASLKILQVHGMRILSPRATAMEVCLLWEVERARLDALRRRILFGGPRDWSDPRAGDIGVADYVSYVLTGEPGGMHYVSTIVADDRLALALVDELALRGVRVAGSAKDGKRDGVALIGEWDTLYGRALPLALEAAVLYREQGTPPASPGTSSWSSRAGSSTSGPSASRPATRSATKRRTSRSRCVGTSTGCPHVRSGRWPW